MSNAGVNYAVIVNYSTTGDLSRPAAVLGSMVGRASLLGDSLGRIGGTISGIGDGILDMAGKALAVVGAAGLIGSAFAVVKTGVLEINTMLEDTKISLAAVFQAGGETKTFGEGLDLAGVIMSRMRKDAAELPGTFADLSKIMQTIATPGMQSGMESEQLEKFAAKTMAVGSILQVSSAMAGREMAQMLGPGGHLTKQNVFGQRLLGGMDSATFNKMSTGDRLSALTKGLEKYNDALRATGQSFQGLSSTFVDHLKLFAGNATAGLFTRVKEELFRINGWFDRNPEKVAKLANAIGDGLVTAFDTARAFALSMVDEIKSAWQQIGPTITSIFKTVTDFFSSGTGISRLIDSIKEALALAVSLKIAGTGMQFAGMGMKLGTALGPSLGMAAEAGPVGAGVAAAALATLGSLALGLAGEFSALTDTTSKYHMAAQNAMYQLIASWDQLTAKFDNSPLKDLLEQYGVSLTSSMSHFLDGINMLLQPLEDFANILRGMHILDPAKEAVKREDHSAAVVEAIQLMGSEKFGHEGNLDDKGRLIPPVHNTTIHKVEIVISSNQDPSRIARLTVDKLADLSRTATGNGFANLPARR